MPHDEFDNLVREPMLRNRQSAIDVLKTHGWLLIPDVRVDLLSIGAQGVFCGVKLDTNIEADFATYEILRGRLHWQFVYVGSPTARILDGSQLSAEFQHSLQQIERWRELIPRNGFSLPLKQSLPDTTRTSFSYRIIIGQSHHQTDEERSVINASRQNDLRIRSFDWLLEKPVHYSEREIDLLDQVGHAGTAATSGNL